MMLWNILVELLVHGDYYVKAFSRGWDRLGVVYKSYVIITADRNLGRHHHLQKRTTILTYFQKIWNNDNGVIPKWSRAFSEWSEFREPDKSLMHELGSI